MKQIDGLDTQTLNSYIMSEYKYTWLNIRILFMYLQRLQDSNARTSNRDSINNINDKLCHFTTTYNWSLAPKPMFSSNIKVSTEISTL